MTSPAAQKFGQHIVNIIEKKGFSNTDFSKILKACDLVRRDDFTKKVPTRKTLENWIKGEHCPKNMESPQMNCLLEALGASNEDRRVLAKLIKQHHSKTKPNSDVKKKRTISVEIERSEQGAQLLPISADINVDILNEGKRDNVESLRSSRSSFLKIDSLFKALSLSIGILGLCAVSFFAYYKSAGSGDSSQALFMEILPEDAIRLSQDGFVIPDSDKTTINPNVLQGLNGLELYVARNEIFARRGKKFVRASSICLQNHFNSYGTDTLGESGWYTPMGEDVRLSTLEMQNADIIYEYECSKRGGRYTCNNKLNRC